MDIFSQVDCMVADGVMTESRANAYKRTMSHLNGLQTNDLLMYIAASQIQQIAEGDFNPTPVSGDFDALSGSTIMADTSGGTFTVTLPADPSIGDRIDIYDAQSTFATNNLTVARNGQLIDGSASNLVANLDNAHMSLIFNGGAQGWSVYNL